MIINPYRFTGAGGTGYVLDDYTGATAGYSLRALSSSYETTDAVISARKNTQDLATFTAEQVTDGTLEAWAATGTGGNAYLRLMFDQTGNGNTAVQLNNAFQPLLVSGGTLLSGGAEFDGTQDFFDCGFGHGATSSQSMFVVGSTNTFQVRLALDGRQANDDGLGFLFLGGINNFMRMHADTTDVFTGVTVSNTQYLWSGIYGSSTATIFRDGTQTDTSSAPSAMSANTTTYKIGKAGYASSAFWKGNINEVIIYPDDQSANRTGIESNIKTHYGIT